MFQESSFFVQRLVYLVHYQVGGNVKCTNWRVQCDPAWEEFYAAQLQNFLHKVKMSQSASCLTENNQPHTNSTLVSVAILELWHFSDSMTYPCNHNQPSCYRSTTELYTWNSLKDYCGAHSYFRSSKQTGKQAAGELGIVRWCRWRCRWQRWRPVSTGPRGNRGRWCEIMLVVMIEMDGIMMAVRVMMMIYI